MSHTHQLVQRELYCPCGQISLHHTLTQGVMQLLSLSTKFLSKQSSCLPTKKQRRRIRTMAIFDTHLFSKHAIPQKLVSDSHPKIHSCYCCSFMQLPNVRCHVSTANHLETDGKYENLILTLSAMLQTRYNHRHLSCTIFYRPFRLNKTPLLTVVLSFSTRNHPWLHSS